MQEKYLKKIVAIYAMLVMAFGAVAQPTMMMPTVASEGMYGPVKAVVSRLIDTTESGATELFSSETKIYDNDGRLTDEIWISKYSLHYKVSYQYHPDGRPLSIYYDAGPATRDELYTYANDGRLLRVDVRYFDGDSNIYHVTKHDDEGRPISIMDTASCGRICTYCYDVSERLKILTVNRCGNEETTYYGPYGIDSAYRPYGKDYYRYDSIGRIVDEIHGSKSGPNYYYTNLDQYGNWISRRIRYADGKEFVEDRIIIYYGE